VPMLASVDEPVVLMLDINFYRYLSRPVALF